MQFGFGTEVRFGLKRMSEVSEVVGSSEGAEVGACVGLIEVGTEVGLGEVEDRAAGAEVVGGPEEVLEDRVVGGVPGEAAEAAEVLCPSELSFRRV
jgi:hypothetical protein